MSPPKRILIATGNAHKVKEFRQMLASESLTWDDLSSHPNAIAVDETGETFHDNACLKASDYARQFDTWALADDSGLEVDALGGKPGVHSARWAEMNKAGKGDADNNALLLRQLDAVPDDRRTGRFVCELALSDPSGKIVLSARGTVEGTILRSPRGTNGFGYDPLFLVPGLGLTTAELPSDQKHALSHRGNALRVLRSLMLDAGLA
ncbi:RdgB/HAM1 family non-canonical purine NTP pyrophosphatase [Humisphaera borealis]|uniref:dITP/XTP pyrophosphatase n=1 Tax=Humisphaera borealis TaxID=2807512 RepID=A0A7M2WWN8_9BACT|nr:RdgB/HAM1 family non-canonical purine NTP pyrophosphatase [Humisphaera borealis]QOV89809.1 RdgB/HAM1 family non-canonical purine NTP pyrophosphatase [Humisphaera borealis]